MESPSAREWVAKSDYGNSDHLLNTFRSPRTKLHVYELEQWLHWGVHILLWGVRLMAGRKQIFFCNERRHESQVSCSWILLHFHKDKFPNVIHKSLYFSSVYCWIFIPSASALSMCCPWYQVNFYSEHNSEITLQTHNKEKKIKNKITLQYLGANLCDARSCKCYNDSHHIDR